MMFSPDDPTYLERRAEDELDAAQDATHPAAVRAHYQLAAMYLDRLYRPDQYGKREGAAG